MAIYHLKVKPVQRSKGQSSIASAAYRAGVSLYDARTGEIHDYTRKRGISHSEIITPNDEKIDREKLWNLAEAAEKRKDGTPAREYEIALPKELKAYDRKYLAQLFAGELALREGCAVDLAIHSPRKGSDNYHAHILCTTRIFESGGLGAKCDVELSDRDRAKKGLQGRKAELAEVREIWANIINYGMKNTGHDERVDHRSLKEQGIDREPTIHLGPAATAMERRGLQTERGEINRLIRAQAEADRKAALEKAAAAQAEADRKAALEKAAAAQAEADRKAALEKDNLQKINSRANNGANITAYLEALTTAGYLRKGAGMANARWTAEAYNLCKTGDISAIVGICDEVDASVKAQAQARKAEHDRAESEQAEIRALWTRPNTASKPLPERSRMPQEARKEIEPTQTPLPHKFDPTRLMRELMGKSEPQPQEPQENKDRITPEKEDKGRGWSR
jgi:hypothetical protein